MPINGFVRDVQPAPGGQPIQFVLCLLPRKRRARLLVIRKIGSNLQSNQALQKSATASPILVEAEKLLEQKKEFSQSVAQRAYDYFEARGREWGHELEDWFKAEAEVLRQVPVEIVETEKQLIVRAEVPGFQAFGINVSFEPRFLNLSGKTEQVTEKEAEQTVYSERRSQRFCRCVALPTEVDTTTATATRKDGVLELTVAKVSQSAPINVEVKAA